MKNKIEHYQAWNENGRFTQPALFRRDSVDKDDDVVPRRALEERIARQEKIIAALIRRVEHSVDHHANAYSMFQTAIVLEEEVRVRTSELSAAFQDLEKINGELKAAKEAAEKLNATKTRFLAAAGHDLLQPLNAARLSLSALKEEPLADGATGLVAQIDRSLTSVEQLMRALMDIAKLDAGVTQPELCSIPIERVLQGLYWDFIPVARQQGLKLRMIGSPVTVLSDPVFLRRILQNLLSNALRYTRSGGVLVLAHKQEDRLLISVHDTGIGIAADERDKIFNEFHRGAAREAHAVDGLGLGLAIARRMAQALDHDLRFHSEPGRGTVFSVSLPLSDMPPLPCSRQIKRGSLKLAPEGAFVVIIENDKTVRIAMESLLSRWSCQTVSAAGIDEMLAAFDEIERTPDLVIADYHLDEGENGLDAIAAVVQRFSQPIPGLIITADHRPDVAVRVASARYALLTKPVEPAELRALMSHLLTAAGGRKTDGSAAKVPSV